MNPGLVGLRYAVPLPNSDVEISVTMEDDVGYIDCLHLVIWKSSDLGRIHQFFDGDEDA